MNPQQNPQRTEDQSRPAKHHSYLRVHRRHRLVWIAVAGIATVLGLALLAFIAVKPFRNEIDELYYSVYATYFIDPTLSNIATKYANVAYCGTSSRFQRLDVYSPKYVVGPAPVVIYIHGGGWAVGDKFNNNINIYGTQIVRNNMALVSINYRLAPDYKYPTQNQDVACAVHYIQSHASDYKIDSNNIGLWGDSAGGQLAAMVALDPQIKQTHTVKAVVEFYGTADLWGQINRTVNGVSKPDKRVSTYLGSATNKELADQASPVNADLRDAPPFLLFHGTNDTIVPYDQSAAFAQKLQAAGNEVTLRPVNHANHNFSATSQPSGQQITAEMIKFYKNEMRR